VKLLILAEGNTLANKISKRFGHTPYLIVYNIDTKEF